MMIKKKICFPTFSAISGGSNNSTLLMVQRLDKEKFEPILIYPQEGEILNKVRKDGNIKYEIIGLPNIAIRQKRIIKQSFFHKLLYSIFLIPYFIKTVNYLRKSDFEIVHTNDLLTTIVWGIAAKINNIKVVWHVRQMKSSKLLDKIRLRVSDCLIFVAHQNKAKFSKRILNTVTHSVVHNCVDIGKFRPTKTNKEKVRQNNAELKVIGYISHLEKRKRPELFLKLVVELSKKYEKIKFVIAGRDNSHGYYTDLIDKTIKDFRLEERLDYLGYKEDVPKVLNSVDILLFTSEVKGEAFPRIVIEALSCGIPVVSTKSAGVVEAIINGKNGFLVEDYFDLVAKTEVLINDDKLIRTLSRKARKHIVQNFSCKEYGSKIEAVYEKL